MKTIDKILTAYITGSLLTANLIGLHQDWLGKEKYLEYANNHWVNSHATMPVHIVTIIACIIILGFIIWSVKDR
jgi:hypothetical protein